MHLKLLEDPELPHWSTLINSRKHGACRQRRSVNLSKQSITVCAELALLFRRPRPLPLSRVTAKARCRSLEHACLSNACSLDPTPRSPRITLPTNCCSAIDRVHKVVQF